MRIGIDARLFGLEHTGIGRYVMELVTNLLKIDSRHQYTIFLHPAHLDDLPKKPNLQIVPVELRHYTLAEQLQFPKVIHQQHLDLLHVPHFNVPLFINTPFIVTIHDLLWHEVLGYHVTTLNPLFYSLKYLGYRAVVRHAIKRSQAIITPSRWVKQQIINRFSLSPEKITVIYEGVDHSFRSQAPSQDVTIKTPFIVYTGSLYPHKNIITLLRALKLVNKKLSPNLTLVVVSARSVFTERVARSAFDLDLTKYYQHIGFLPDKELNRLYHRALALVQPSTSEGFGLTGLEAMAAGLPVISSQAASLPEVYEEAALYFDPYSPEDLATKIYQLATQKSLRQALIQAGFAQTAKFSWRQMAKETLSLYEHCLSVRSPQ